MTPLRVLVVDDEKLAVRRLVILLRRMTGLETIGEAHGVRDAISKIETLSPDVVLLDIKMRDGDGFDVVDALARSVLAPSVIFVTAFDRYAVQAFEASAIGYLLKPVEPEQLARALDKARLQREARDAAQRIAELREVICQLRADACEESETHETDLWLKRGSGLVRVPLETINLVSSEDDYVRLHTAAESYLMRGSIRQFEQKLGTSRFIRIHRRWLLRKTEIAGVRSLPLGRTAVVLRSGQQLVAGRVYGKALRCLHSQLAS
jgi:two-component system LytT family response regulator